MRVERIRKTLYPFYVRGKNIGFWNGRFFRHKLLLLLFMIIPEKKENNEKKRKVG